MTTASAQQPGTNSQPAKTTNGSASQRPNLYLLPPEEQFWKRYSPHLELPISSVASFLGHTVIVLVMLALIFAAAKWGWNRTQPIEFTAVKLPGGGGGNPEGNGPAPGVGDGPLEDVGPESTEPLNVLALPDHVPLNATQVQETRKIFANDPDVNGLLGSGNENIERLSKLNKGLVSKLRDGLMPGKGEKGTGSGGGNDKGKGTGEGPGIGNGKGQLTEREKRMLRWVMAFETQNPHDYLNQLAGLGAYIAIPTGREGEYMLIEEPLKRPVRPEVKDVAKLNRIYWVDDKPQSVGGVLHTLGIKTPASHFVAFMPQKLEADLFEKELKYAKGRSEDEIFETKFKVVHTRGGSYDVVVTHQTFK